MRSIKKSINWILIILFVALGIIGLLIPIMPQAIFFAIALIILSFEVPIIENYIEKKINRESKLGKIYFDLKNKLEKFFKHR